MSTTTQATIPAGRIVALYPIRAGQALSLADRILNDRAASHWLQAALASSLRRDLVDAVSDAELLLSVLTARLEELQEGGAR